MEGSNKNAVAGTGKQGGNKRGGKKQHQGGANKENNDKSHRQVTYEKKYYPVNSDSRQKEDVSSKTAEVS